MVSWTVVSTRAGAIPGRTASSLVSQNHVCDSKHARRASQMVASGYVWSPGTELSTGAEVAQEARARRTRQTTWSRPTGTLRRVIRRPEVLAPELLTDAQRQLFSGGRYLVEGARRRRNPAAAPELIRRTSPTSPRDLFSREGSGPRGRGGFGSNFGLFRRPKPQNPEKFATPTGIEPVLPT